MLVKFKPEWSLLRIQWKSQTLCIWFHPQSFKKARRDLKNTEPYFYTIQEALAKILELSPDAGNIYFDEREDVPKQERKQGYIVVTADKGMAGAYNHNVIKIAEKEALSDNKNMLLLSVR